MKHYTVPVPQQVVTAIDLICARMPGALWHKLFEEASVSLVCQQRLVQLANSYASRGL